MSADRPTGGRQEHGGPTRRRRTGLPVGGRRPDGTAPVQAGTVYVLDARAFTRQPPYLNSNIGTVITECQWTSTSPVEIVDAVQVSVSDLPGPVPTHDPLRVQERIALEPRGFPWGAPDTPPTRERH